MVLFLEAAGCCWMDMLVFDRQQHSRTPCCDPVLTRTQPDQQALLLPGKGRTARLAELQAACVYR